MCYLKHIILQFGKHSTNTMFYHIRYCQLQFCQLVNFIGRKIVTDASLFGCIVWIGLVLLMGMEWQQLLQQYQYQVMECWDLASVQHWLLVRPPLGKEDDGEMNLTIVLNILGIFCEQSRCLKWNVKLN